RSPRRGDPRRRLHLRRARPPRLPLRIHERSSVVKRLPVLVAVCALGHAGAQAPAITVERVRETVTWLASDDREGRDSPSRGLEAAGNWLAERFEAAGLEQAEPKSWFHDYTLRGYRLDSRSIALTVKVTLKAEGKPDQTTVCELKPDDDVRLLRAGGVPNGA